MGKLYVFGIGGTGSRVLKALTMLMAAGVKVNTDEVVPLIIDPDLAAADLARAQKSMTDYVNIRKNIDDSSASKGGFFATKIRMDIVPQGRIPVVNTAGTLFKDYIGLPLMKDANGRSDANMALASMLFSQKNLDSGMDVGFKGNPNIGSVVLNQFSFSEEYRAFAASVKKEDRVFVVSSIFGGTGASGFPLLVKEIRKEKGKGEQENESLRNVPIGAVTVLPYFDVKADEKSEIDSQTFISKAKAALSYYDANLNEVNSLYYIADRETMSYENSEGGATQRNAAHFVELAAALAIVDFAAQNDDSFTIKDGVVSNPTYKEFGINEASKSLIFNDLSHLTNNTIKRALTQFTLFCKYLDEQFNDSYPEQPWAITKHIDDNFVRQSFFQSDLKGFKTSFMEWLGEMAANSRAFAPFDLTEKKDALFSLIKGGKPTSNGLLSRKNYALFDHKLGSLEKEVNASGEKPLTYLLELFYRATAELAKTKLGI